jgi:hypothetical protein
MFLISRVLLVFVAKPLLFLYTFKTRFRDRIDISIHHKHLQQKIVAVDDELNQGGKFAIFAIFPRMEIFHSVIRVRDMLIEEGFKPIFIINENPLAAAWISRLGESGNTVILRRNIGHDFGAYQAGIAFLQSKSLLSTCEQLLLLNDSVIFTPRSGTLFSDFLKVSQPWQSLTVSTRPEFHAQSYFLAFSSEILKKSVFTTFWREYYPTSLRHLVIKRGEIGLSKALTSSGWLPTALTFSTGSNKIDPVKNPLKLEEKVALFWDSRKSISAGSLSGELVENRVFHELYENNPSQTLGLYLARVAGFPLKWDLLYGQMYSLEDILECLSGCGIKDEEIDELRKLYLSTLVLKQGAINSFLRRFGLVR